VPRDGEKRPCPHRDENGNACKGEQTFNRLTKPPGWYTYNADVRPGWLCDKGEHFDIAGA